MIKKLEKLFLSLNQEAEERWENDKIVNLVSLSVSDDGYSLTLAIGKYNTTYHDIICNQQGWSITSESSSNPLLDDLMTYTVMPALFPSHGGRRKGAGRKNENLVPLTIRITQDAKNKIMDGANDKRVSYGKYIESLLLK